LQLVAHRTLSGALAEHSANWPLSGFLGARPLKYTGLSGVPPDCLVIQQSNDHLRPMVDCTNCGAVYGAEVRRQSTTTGCTGLSGVPPDCPVQQKDRELQLSIAPNPNGQLTWHTPDSEH
jgi:acetyl esterase/lipase